MDQEITKMIDSGTQYIIYKERETKLMNQIEQKLAAQERGEPKENRQPWYSAVAQWLEEKIFSRNSPNSQCCPEDGAI